MRHQIHNADTPHRVRLTAMDRTFSRKALTVLLVSLPSLFHPLEKPARFFVVTRTRKGYIKNIFNKLLKMTQFCLTKNRGGYNKLTLLEIYIFTFFSPSGIARKNICKISRFCKKLWITCLSYLQHKVFKNYLKFLKIVTQ